jgi:hypothetical protein
MRRKHHFHGHIRKRLVARLTGKNEIASLELTKVAEDCDGARDAFALCESEGRTYESFRALLLA